MQAKKNKVVLISTFPDIQAYGVRMVSSVLKRGGFKTNIIFLNAPFGELYSDDILEDVAGVAQDSLFVGISLMTNFFDRARQLTSYLKERLDIPVVWGGIHTAVKPEECLKYADMICIGESEEVILPLTESIALSKDPEGINNVWFCANGKVVKNIITPFIDNIDHLPFPDCEYPDHFVIDKNRLLPMDSKAMEQYMGYEYSTIVTRGCFYNCTFCANNFFEKNFKASGANRLRARSMRGVIDELKEAKGKLGFVRIMKFADDLFMALPMETLEEFHRLYKASGLGLPLDITGIHPLIFREDKFKLLLDAGLQYARMGIQTGSQNSRKLYGRNETENKIMEDVNIIHKYRNRLKAIRYDFMVDNPWEKIEDIKGSLRLLANIPKPYKINLFSLTMYPGTELYARAKDEGLLMDEERQVYSKHYHDNVGISYYNALFKIISIYRLPKALFFFLIENESNLWARMIHRILSSGVNLVSGMARLAYLLKEGLSDIVRGDFRRMNKFIFRRTKVVR